MIYDDMTSHVFAIDPKHPKPLPWRCPGALALVPAEARAKNKEHEVTKSPTGDWQDPSGLVAAKAQLSFIRTTGRYEATQVRIEEPSENGLPA